jgi:hypothetical protein
MNDETPDRERFRRTLIKVWTMQIIALCLLGLLQYSFHP